MKKEDIPNQTWFQAIKAANRELIRECGGIEAVARFLGCSLTLVGNWNNWTMADLMPLPEVIRLESDRGKSIVSRAMAGLTGAVVADAVTARDKAPSLAFETARMMGEFSEFMQVNAVASADNVYTLAELRELRPFAVDMRNQMDVIVSVIDQKAAQAAAEVNGE